MVKFNVSLLLAAMIVAPITAGYTTQSVVYTPATIESSTLSSTEIETICPQDVDVPETCDGSDGWYPVSVVGKEGYYCTKGPICAGESGSCPGAHRDLVYGSSCVSLSEGIYGCAPNTECPTESTETEVHDDCEVTPDTPETATVPPPVYTPETQQTEQTPVYDTTAPPTDVPEQQTEETPVYGTTAPPTDVPEQQTEESPVYRTTAPPSDVPEQQTEETPVYDTTAPPTDVPEQQTEETPVYGTTAPPTDVPEQQTEETPVYGTTAPPTDVPEQQTEETPVYDTTAPPTDVPEQQTEETLAQTDAPTFDSDAPVAGDILESETVQPETSTLSRRSLRLN